MKKAIKRILSVFLTVTLIITTFFIFDPKVVKTEVKAATYTRNYAFEYYGTESPICYLASGYSGKKAENAKSPITGAGYTLIDFDLNSDAGGDWVYMGYMRESAADKEKYALRNIRMWNTDESGGEGTSTTSTVNGYTCTYYIVGDNGTTNQDLSICKIGAYADGRVDFNKGKSRAPYLYPFATRDYRAGPPITSITIDTTAWPSGYSTATWFNNTSEAADCNKGAGGDYVYIHFKSSYTSVSTADLVSAMNTAQGYLNNPADYDDNDIAALNSAMNTAKAILNDYNADGISKSYSQTSITNAKNALTTPRLKRTSAMFATNNATGSWANNATGGTVGYTESVGQYNVSKKLNYGTNYIYAKPATGYTFNGWYWSRYTTTPVLSGDIDTGYAASDCELLSNGVYRKAWTVDNQGDGIWFNARFSINSYYLDLNGTLDGVYGGNISGYGTASVYLNGSVSSAP